MDSILVTYLRRILKFQQTEETLPDSTLTFSL